jgi:hypothetical protein
MMLALATSAVCSPPALVRRSPPSGEGGCGEGLGVGVNLTPNLRVVPPSLTLPRKGGGDGEIAQAAEEHAR